MVNVALPKAVLLDLDDTILDDSGNALPCWRAACADHAADLGGVDPGVLHEAIERVRLWFWSDPERHRVGRLDLHAASCEVIGRACDEVGLTRSDGVAKMATSYLAKRDATIRPFPEAVETVRWLRESGCRLALITNGAAVAQRSKVERFALAELFDAILIEGEVGYGKPDPRVYQRALDALRVEGSDAWMVGDNPDWDVGPPQRLGVLGIWLDRWGRGLPDDHPVRPDRVIRQLAELRGPATASAARA
jgi:putative hydrolase of the HAD superfamily